MRTNPVANGVVADATTARDYLIFSSWVGEFGLITKGYEGSANSNRVVRIVNTNSAAVADRALGNWQYSFASANLACKRQVTISRANTDNQTVAEEAVPSLGGDCAFVALLNHCL